MYALLDSDNGLPVHDRGEHSMFVLTLEDVERMLRVTDVPPGPGASLVP